jgi:hypothetical protein
MESKHLVVKCSLKIGEKVVNTHASIDCGATGIAFVDKDFVCHNQLEGKELKESQELEVIDRRPIKSGTITSIARSNIGIWSHQEQLLAFITKLEHYPILLGLPWLLLHDVMVKFRSCRIGFESSYCQQHCQYHSNVWVWGNHMERAADLERPKLDISVVAASPFLRRIRREKLKLYTVTL